MATHGVTTDGHLVRLSGEVSVDQFGKLWDRQIRGSADRKQFSGEQVAECKRTSSVM